MARNSIGRITQVIGAVVDVRFDGELPEILTALHIDQEGLTFLFEVNNIRIFCGGSNWIPADSFLTKYASAFVFL